MGVHTLGKYPFLRFVFPLAAGILTHGLFFPAGGAAFVVCFLCLLGMAAGCWSWFLFQGTYSQRHWFGIGLSIFFFSIGLGLAGLRQKSIRYGWSEQKEMYIVSLTAGPQEKERSFLCEATVEWCVAGYAANEEATVSRPVGRKVLFYLQKDSAAARLEYGERLLLHTRISSPRNRGNPDEFDYAGFLFHRGFSGTAWVTSEDWRPLSCRPESFSLRKAALQSRDSLLALYRTLKLEGDERAVLSALTVGYKEDLSEEIRNGYALSGVSHVLALSGLHLGLLYFLLDFLLRWMNRRRSGRMLKSFLLIAALWFFACMVGLPASVVRSALMFSLVALSQIGTSRPVTLHTMALAAFCMLLYDPYYMYDVGFQLSFAAVGAILVIQPRLYRSVRVSRPVVRYAWGLTTVSLAAQIGTIPLVLYYFSRFSLFFLPANLVVIPWITLILYGAVVLPLLGFFPSFQMVWAEGLSIALRGVNRFAAALGEWPYASLSFPRFTAWDAWWLYLFLLLLCFYFICHQRKMLFPALGCLLLPFLFHAYEVFKTPERPFIQFYNVPASPAVHLVGSSKESYLVPADTANGSLPELYKATSRFWSRRFEASPRLLSSEYVSSRICLREGIICFGNRTICLLNDNRWKNKMAAMPFSVDYLYVCRGYKGSLKTLPDIWTVRKVVLDAALPVYRLERFKQECRNLNWDYISIADEGAYRVEL